MKVKKLTKRQILDDLIREGYADSDEEAIAFLADMGMTWQEVRDFNF